MHNDSKNVCIGIRMYLVICNFLLLKFTFISLMHFAKVIIIFIIISAANQLITITKLETT